MEAVVCHCVYHSIPFCHISLLANVHCNESLVWFEAFSFCCTISTGSSLGLLRCPVVALCQGDPAVLALQDPPLQMLQQFIDGVEVRVGLAGSWVGPPTCSPALSQLAPHYHYWKAGPALLPPFMWLATCECILSQRSWWAESLLHTGIIAPFGVWIVNPVLRLLTTVGRWIHRHSHQQPDPLTLVINTVYYWHTY